MRLMKTNIKDLFVLNEPTFSVNKQKWPKTLSFFSFLVLIKGIYEIVQTNNIYIHRVDTMSLHLTII